MSDSDTAQPTPEGDHAPAAPAAGPVEGLPQPGAPGPAEAQATPATPDADVPTSGEPSKLKSWARSASAKWAAVAVVCVVVGAAASLIAANSIADHGATESRQTFAQSSTGIASALKLAIQREEELSVSASTFFAHNPQGTPAEFKSWVKWARTLRRFPELRNLGLVALVRSDQLAEFQQQVTGHVVKAPTPATARTAAATSAAGSTSGSASGTSSSATASSTITSATTAASIVAKPLTPAELGLHITPASAHHYYCLTVAELVRSPGTPARAGRDYCGRGTSLLIARNSGVSHYRSVSSGGQHGLEELVPVYRGNATPRSAFGRAAASVGWLRVLIVPSVMLAQVLRGHPNNAVAIDYHVGGSRAAFAARTPQSHGQSASVSLHNGWTVTTFGASVQNGISADDTALAVLIGGVLLSVLLGLLVFVTGSRRRRPPARAAREVPNVDLYDDLTGLPNRALTLDRAERMVARAKRQSGMLAGALFIDIDWFKDVNVKLGEAAGDQLLTIVAERLEQVVRAGDTVGRLGGDDFVVLVESAARGVRLDSLARRIIESLHKPVELDGFGPSFFATASIGVAFGRYDTPEDLLRDAQLALLAAKAAGKDRYTLFNANMRSVIESRSVLEAELNTALAEHQFFLLYEPIYEIASHRVVGVEALVRWQHPKQGVLAPDDFVPLAEDTGLIVPIGRWMLEEACNRGAAWAVSGHRVGISVKVSASQLNRDGFAIDVRRALQQSGIDPSLLTLEIAETTVMRELAASSARLQEIKQLGVRIAIDDFGGSGYARHSDLQRMPLDFLKVDRNSLAATDDEDYRSWLLEAILVVGRDLKLTVIATGIETKEQLAALQVMGCTTAQGPFLCKPVLGDAVATLLSNVSPPVAADQHAHSVASAHTVTPAQPVPGSAPAQPGQHAPVAQPAHASPTAAPAKPSQATPPAPPAQPAQPKQAGTPAQPAQATTPTQPQPAGTPTQPKRAATTTQPKQVNRPQQAATPTQPKQAAAPAQPAQGSKPAQPPQAAAPAQPAQAAPAQTTHAVTPRRLNY